MKNAVGLIGGVIAAAHALASAAMGAVLCVDPAGGPCQTTIQGAVDRAAPGDTIQVSAGLYFEAVVVPEGKDGLAILGSGRGATIVDSSPYFDRGVDGGLQVGFLVYSANFAVRNMTIRNGQQGVNLQAPGGVVAGLEILSHSFAGVAATQAATSTRVLANDIRGGFIGILTYAPDVVIRGNVLQGMSEAIAMITGHRGRVVSNRVVWSRIQGIRSEQGDDVVIRDNDIRNVPGVAMELSGRHPTVERNRIRATHTGMRVLFQLEGGSISRNTIVDALDYGMFITSAQGDLVVRGNELTRTGLGLSLNGTGITATLNRVTDVGADLDGYCFEVFGAANVVRHNTARRCSSSGIYVNGSTMTVDENLVSETFGNGVTVDGFAGENAEPFAGTVVSGNLARADAAQGIAIINDARDTRVVGNTARENRTDFCDEGVGTVVTNNRFGTRVRPAASARLPDPRGERARAGLLVS